jgi:oxygen-independent coproporphyrinogen-3 oxidase
LRISIIGIEDERFNRQLRLIANLFFEESEIIMAEQSDADVQIKTGPKIMDMCHITYTDKRISLET